MDATASLATFYDALPRDVLAQVGEGFDPDLHAMHRVLRDPADPGAAPSPAVLNGLIAAAVAPGARVLDAGCGWGGTLLRLAGTRDASGLGITLSPLQAETAAATARARGLAERVTFKAADYTREPLPDAAFDAVVTIETLIHCADKRAVLRRFARAMRPGGVLLLIDDMWTPAAAAAHRDDLTTFLDGWCVPNAPNEEAWVSLIEAAGLSVIERRDLSPLYTPRARATLAALEADTRAALDGADAETRALRMGEIGGYALERLHGAGAMAYTMLVARKA
jgi:cyclopropane fatty-acyl-phospholipid synthase-like methyltransferase